MPNFECNYTIYWHDLRVVLPYSSKAKAPFPTMQIQGFNARCTMFAFKFVRRSNRNNQDMNINGRVHHAKIQYSLGFDFREALLGFLNKCPEQLFYGSKKGVPGHFLKSQAMQTYCRLLLQKIFAVCSCSTAQQMLRIVSIRRPSEFKPCTIHLYVKFCVVFASRV